MAASSLAESEATFDQHAKRVGLHDDWIAGLKAIGVNNFGKLAFAVSQPGQPTPDNVVTQLLNDTGVGRVIAVGDVAVLKRLIFEAQTTVIALIRTQSDPNNDPTQRKIPAAERNARIQEQRVRLAGMTLEGPHEAAFQVYDTVSGMLESDCLRYLPPSKCIPRSMEITAQKPPKELRLDASGSSIKVTEAAVDKECTVSGELDMLEAMTRRALAFDAVGLIDYHVSMRWVQWMFQTLRQPPPPGFSKPNLTQLLRADRQAFVRLQELSRAGIKPTPAGVRPLDNLVTNLPNDHTVTFFLLPTAVPQKAAPVEKESKKEWNKWSNPNWDRNKVWNKTSKQQHGGTKGYGKNGGKLPQALRGCASMTPCGKRLCFAYNIDGCDKAEPGQACDRGYHLCAVKNCHGPHPKSQCNNAKGSWQDPQGSTPAPKNSGSTETTATEVAHAQHHDAPGEYPTPAADADLDKSQPTEALATSFAPVDFSEISYFGIEICSGTGGLTAQLRLHGLPGSFGVDHIVKAGCKAPICKLNLEKEDNVTLVLEWVQHPKCKYVHLGVPCGTASRAREMPLEGGPYPLRSPEHPDGLPNLSQRDQERVRKANLVYAAACRIILACHASGTAWSLENPTNSLFWLTSFWRCVMKQTDPWYATFHSCMYGGARAKSTTLAGSMAKLATLSVDCDKQHNHLPWGKTSTGFATAEETEYPLGLCVALAQVVQEELGLTATPSLTSPDKRARAATFKQTKKSLAFMPDYSHVETAKFQTQPKFAIKDKLPHAVGDVPQHARILRITTPKMGGSSGGCDGYEVAFGVPWTEENFLEEVFRRGHPASLFDSVSDTMRAAITANASLRPEAIISYRAKWLKKWMDRANNLKAQESKLREGISEIHLEGQKTSPLRRDPHCWRLSWPPFTERHLEWVWLGGDVWEQPCPSWRLSTCLAFSWRPC